MQRMNKLNKQHVILFQMSVPNFWAFRGMLAAGGLIILLTFGAFVQNLRNKVTSSRLLLKALLWVFHCHS